ncbi:TIGR02679 family protein [Neorhodopirellula pilleata]|uniref:TIGR02679 family protein n=1 Tax=Neorhodopirellula pilleata TaxID=2714738 RepID=A0A5C6AD58_9BACT|nr:TIGR02679 family protein [Neorhodopirellula pilleata]TWT97347.1 hypothetical protein Pla100_24990 [Neorhodopirellula pilleata]
MNDRVQALLGDPALGELIARLDRRLAKNPQASGTITIKNPTPPTIEAVTSLLGKPPRPGGPLRVNLRELDDVVRHSGVADGLTSAITILLGRPPRHVAIEQQRETDAWLALPGEIAWETTDQLSLVSFAEMICRDGTLRRAARGDLDEGRRLLGRLVDCCSQLPLDAPTPLPVFATRVLGDSHGLDAQRPLCGLVIRAIGQTIVEPLEAPPTSQREWWNRVNVIADELSSTVLVLNLRCVGDGLIDRTLNAHAEIGEPCRLTFRQLRLHPPRFEPATVLPNVGGDVFVCENPSVLAAAADRLGRRSSPLICIEGQPSHAAAGLLAALHRDGISLAYHGDFDRVGLQIVEQMRTRFQATPWRMSANDYAEYADESTPAFTGPVPETTWDDELKATIEQHMRVVFEEQVIDGLMRDCAGDDRLLPSGSDVNETNHHS